MLQNLRPYCFLFSLLALLFMSHTSSAQSSRRVENIPSVLPSLSPNGQKDVVNILKKIGAGLGIKTGARSPGTDASFNVSDLATATTALVSNPWEKTDLTLQMIKTILTAQNEPCTNNDSNCVDRIDLLVKAIGELPKPDKLRAPDDKLAKQLNLNSLLTPREYANMSEAASAKDFISYLSNQIYLPIDPASLNTYKGILEAIEETKGVDDEDKRAAVKKRNSMLEGLFTYFAKLRMYAAHNSVGASNLNYLFKQREKPTQGNTKKSPIELEHNLATQRLDATWHNKMETASPIVVQRQIAYLLAEMNHQLYLNRRLQERTLAAISAIHLQSLSMFASDVSLEYPEEDTD